MLPPLAKIVSIQAGALERCSRGSISKSHTAEGGVPGPAGALELSVAVGEGKREVGELEEINTSQDLAES